jgi:serine/threonine protein kinase
VRAVACLDENAVVRLLQGRLGAEQAAAARAHLDGCAQCRELLAAAARSSLGWSRSDAPEAATQLSRYRVLEPVGAGAMGVVYAAYDPKLDRRVALKVLRGSGDAEALADRLMREAQAMARLSHPNVIAVHDVGTLGDRVFLAMEFVDGVTLAQWLRQEARSWREIRDVFLLAGRGLSAAHQAGLVHRDFKPENVLVGRDGRVRVTDFGLVRMSGEPEEGKETVGSPAYMAPEQMRGGAVDARADVFSFSVALY